MDNKAKRPIDGRQMIAEHIKTHGYDGLYCDICCCSLDDLMPCNDGGIYCKAGHKTPCDCGEGCDFHIGDISGISG